MDSQEPETVVVSDLDEFVRTLVGWHNHKVKVLEHMMEIPSGTEVVFNKNAPMVLEGELLKGFCMGIQLALMELGKLPFEAEMDDEQEVNTDSSEKTIH